MLGCATLGKSLSQNANAVLRESFVQNQIAKREPRRLHRHKTLCASRPAVAEYGSRNTSSHTVVELLRTCIYMFCWPLPRGGVTAVQSILFMCPGMGFGMGFGVAPSGWGLHPRFGTGPGVTGPVGARALLLVANAGASWKR